MAEVDVGTDVLGLFLTGGSNNTDPDASLGGAISTTRIRGLGALVNPPLEVIPGLRIDHVHPASGEGLGVIEVGDDGSLTYQAPGGAAGVPVPIAAGESKILLGDTVNKAVRVYREVNMLFPVGRQCNLNLLFAMNGALGQKNLTSAQRVAGRTTYRCIAAKAGAQWAFSPGFWFPPVAGAQAVYSIAVENPVAGSVQTIPDETTAPTGVTWYTPTTELGAFHFPSIPTGEFKGLWIRRVFPPAGVVAVRENVQLAMTYKAV